LFPAYCGGAKLNFIFGSGKFINNCLLINLFGHILDKKRAEIQGAKIEIFILCIAVVLKKNLSCQVSWRNEPHPWRFHPKDCSPASMRLHERPTILEPGIKFYFLEVPLLKLVEI